VSSTPAKKRSNPIGATERAAAITLSPVHRTFDAIVIGAGQAGPSLVGRLAGAGMTVAMIERHLFGGTCVNTGCTPTKTLVATAEVAHQARRAADFGVRIEGFVAIDMRAVKARKDAVVSASRTSLEDWLRAMKNCTVLQGHARFESPHEVRVGDDLISAEKIFLNVGGRAIVPDMPGVQSIPYLTNTSIIELDVLPRHLVIVGGSYIGLEFAQMYRRFGSEVTVIEKGPRLLWREDPDISMTIEEIFKAEGIEIRTEAECVRFEPRRQDIVAGVNCATGEPEVVGSHVLLAVGRRPNTDDLAIEKAGIKLDPHGYIVVDDQLRTNVPGIWALGDCNGRGAFTHTAYNDYEIVAQNLLDGRARRVTDRIPCYGLFIDPPLGRIGMTEMEARASNRRIRIGTRPMTRVARAVEKGETQGFMKIIVDAQSNDILGAAILGSGGDEAVHCILDTMSAKAPYTTLRDTVHIHPTVSELIPTVLGELKP
jgi:pyruvate/2-oxoglutarate dehydrogenase complex dihydrolipoamide dehydrogenase (E3) component